jgi:hypothetical protein
VKRGRRIEFFVSDPELLALACFVERNDGDQPRQQNWAKTVQGLVDIGWTQEDASELVRSFAKQLDSVHAKAHKEAQLVQ